MTDHDERPDRDQVIAEHERHRGHIEEFGGGEVSGAIGSSVSSDLAGPGAAETAAGSVRASTRSLAAFSKAFIKRLIAARRGACQPRAWAGSAGRT